MVLPPVSKLDIGLHAGADFQALLAFGELAAIHRERHLVMRIAIRIARERSSLNVSAEMKVTFAFREP